MAVESLMVQGYPAVAVIEDFFSDKKIEIMTYQNPNWFVELQQAIWGILKAVEWALPLGPYCPTASTVNVRGGKYLYKGELKTYTPSADINPTDNDTTYIWLEPDNAIDSAIDGTGWPTTEHIKLAEVDVDETGVITDVRDLREQSFLQYLASYLTHAGTSAEAMPVYWYKTTPLDNDEVRIPIYGRNDNSEKIEYARLVIKFADVSDGSEDAEVSLSAMIAGTLTNLGNIVGTSATQTLTNKAINGADYDIVCIDDDVVCVDDEIVTLS